MNNSKLMAITLAVIIGVSLFSCVKSSEKVEDAKEDVAEAKENLVDEEEAYLKEVEAYKAKVAEEITANERSIAEFNKRIATQKSEAKGEYEKTITELKNKNSDLKKKLDDFKSDSKANWEEFKVQFNKDMDELGLRIRSLNTEN